MKHRNESEILSKLLAITKAVPIEPTKEELEQIRDLEEQQRLSAQHSKSSQALNEKRRRDEAMLAQARGEVAAAREA
jgi:large subunit ribosomal protein MRP49